MFFAVLFQAPPPPHTSVFYTVFLCFFRRQKTDYLLFLLFAVLFLSSKFDCDCVLCFTCRTGTRTLLLLGPHGPASTSTPTLVLSFPGSQADKGLQGAPRTREARVGEAGEIRG